MRPRGQWATVMCGTRRMKPCQIAGSPLKSSELMCLSFLPSIWKPSNPARYAPKKPDAALRSNEHRPPACLLAGWLCQWYNPVALPEGALYGPITVGAAQGL